MTMKSLSRLVAVVTALALSACGGGGPKLDSSTPVTATASDITLSLGAATILNTGAATVTATVTAVDANRNTVSGIPVTLSVDNDATISVTTSTTNSSGVVTGTIGIGANRGNRVVTIKAVSGSLAKTAVLQVIGTKVAGTALPAVVLPSAAAKVQFKVTDGNNAAIAGQAITVTGPGGVQSTGTTDTSGVFEYSYTAPATTGSLDIRASAAGVDSVTTVLVQSVGTLPSVPANSVRSSSVRANPSVVNVNTVGSTANSAEIRALFVGDSNQPIKNVRVRFDLNGDVNSIGGTFTTSTTLIYSDANGVAVTSYIPGSRFSPTDGVTVRACWDYNDFAVGACPNSTLTTLTVIADPLSVTVGTDGLIGVDVPLVYYIRLVVQVNDSSGLAKPNVAISPLLDLPSFNQGFWTYNSALAQWQQTITNVGGPCLNEDVNRNGVLEIYSNGGREDANSNGQLDPRKADAVVSYEGSNVTDATGRLILRITYPQNLGSWDQYKLTVAASGVAGTEGRASYSGTLPVPITVVKAQGEPAFSFSPYGKTDGGVRSTVTTPDGSASAALCTK